MNRGFHNIMINISRRCCSKGVLSDVSLRPIIRYARPSRATYASDQSDTSYSSLLIQPSIGVSRPFRRFCESTNGSDELTYQQLSKMLDSGNIKLFDVREPEELKEFGFIKGAINVPMREIEEAFSLSAAEFSASYGADLPPRDDPHIVLHCLGGIRSRRSLDVLHQLGYKSSRHYLGGFEDWLEQGAPVQNK